MRLFVVASLSEGTFLSTGQLVLGYFPVEPLGFQLKFLGAGQFYEKLPVRGMDLT